MEAEAGGGRRSRGQRGTALAASPAIKRRGQRRAGGEERRERRGRSARRERSGAAGPPCRGNGGGGVGVPRPGSAGTAAGLSRAEPAAVPALVPAAVPAESAPGAGRGDSGAALPAPPEPPAHHGQPPSLTKGCELHARAAAARWAVPWAWNRQGKGARATAGGDREAGTALILFPSFRLFLARVTPCSKTILPVSREEQRNAGTALPPYPKVPPEFCLCPLVAPEFVLGSLGATPGNLCGRTWGRGEPLGCSLGVGPVLGVPTSEETQGSAEITQGGGRAGGQLREPLRALPNACTEHGMDPGSGC